MRMWFTFVTDLLLIAVLVCHMIAGTVSLGEFLIITFLMRIHFRMKEKQDG